MKDSQLYKSVLENLHNSMLKNVRDIDIQKGDIIVLGYSKGKGRRVNEMNKDSFVMMGKFISDDLDWLHIELENTLVLDTSQESEVLSICDGDDYIETADWWRIPTDDEMKLYNTMFTFATRINNIIDRYENGNIGDFDMVSKLKKISEELKTIEK
jgi:hypothetical protein